LAAGAVGLVFAMLASATSAMDCGGVVCTSACATDSSDPTGPRPYCPCVRKWAMPPILAWWLTYCVCCTAPDKWNAKFIVNGHCELKPDDSAKLQCDYGWGSAAGAPPEYCDVITRCIREPCQHGGSCTDRGSGMGYTCACVDGYSGNNC